MQPLRTWSTPTVNTILGVYNQLAYTPLSGIKPSLRAYMQPPGVGLLPTAYTPPSTGFIPTVYILLSGTGATFTVYT